MDLEYGSNTYPRYASTVLSSYLGELMPDQVLMNLIWKFEEGGMTILFSKIASGLNLTKKKRYSSMIPFDKISLRNSWISTLSSSNSYA